MKVASTGDRFYQPPGQMRWIWDKLADHEGDHVVSLPKGDVSVTSPGTKSSYSRPPQSLNPSIHLEDYSPCAGGLSAFNAIGTNGKSLRRMGLTQKR